MIQYPSGEIPLSSLDTCFRIVETLHESSPLTPSEVAEKHDIAPSTAHRHLTVLTHFRYVREQDGKYSPGYRFLEVGNRAREQTDMYRIGKPRVEALAEETGEIANLIIEEDGLGVRLCVRGDEQGIPTDTLVGQHVFLHTNSGGKAMLANLPESRRESIIDQHQLPERTGQTITDAEQLRSELKEINDKGVAFNDEERIEGLRAAGVPIMGPNDDVVAALSVAGPSKRLKDEWLQEELPALLSEAANEIELEIKYSPSR
jgi:IclR family acetate operon transcriptional repressor